MANEGPRDNDFTLTLMVLLMGFLLTGYLLSATSDGIHEVHRLLAWIHVKPFAVLDRMIPGSGDLPWFGQWLLTPAGLVEPTLRPMTGSGRSPIPWSVSMVVVARCAAALHCLPCCALMAVVGWLRPDLKFRTHHTLDSLIADLASTWPTGAIARHLFDAAVQSHPMDVARSAARPSLGKLLVPLQEADDRFAGADALWPEHWIVNRGLASPAASARTGRDLSETFSDSDWQSLTQDAVSEALAMQLSEPWSGIASLKSAEKALVAAFVHCHDLRLEECRAILIALAQFADRHHDELSQFDNRLSEHKAFMSRIDGVLRSESGKALIAVADGHAWKMTAFMALFHCAREGRGVVAPCEFLWLKHTNRLLWYVLNSAGNTVAVAETAGINGHYRTECQMECALHCPAVRQVSRVLLEDYLDQSWASVARRKRRFLMRQSPTERIAAGRTNPPPSSLPGLAKAYGGQSCGS